MEKQTVYGCFLLLGLIVVCFTSCVHDPVFLSDDDNPMVIDTMMVDTMVVDTLSVSCVTTNMTFANNVMPVIDASCRSCHSGATPAGGVDLSTHAGVQTVALSGALLGTIDHRSGFSTMPQGNAKLDACVISQVEVWIIDGALNN